MTDQSDHVEIVRTIEAPREQVFRAWTDPDELRRWWGPGEFRCPEAQVDLRPGGSYRLVMQPTAGDPFVLGGTYREVEPPARLVYTWRWETGPAADGPSRWSPWSSAIAVSGPNWSSPTASSRPAMGPLRTRWAGRAASSSSRRCSPGARSMPEATGTVEIQRSPAEVFAFLAEGENDRGWRSGVLDIRRKSGHGRGAIYEQGVKGPFGRRVPADYEITAYEPDRRIGFRAIAGPVRPEGSYELSPLDSGGTRVTFALRAAPRGLARLMSPMVSRTMRSEVAQLDRLRGVLEDPAA